MVSTPSSPAVASFLDINFREKSILTEMSLNFGRNPSHTLLENASTIEDLISDISIVVWIMAMIDRPKNRRNKKNF